MKHLLTRFEKNLYEWQFWTADVVKDFKSYLKEKRRKSSRQEVKELPKCLNYRFCLQVQSQAVQRHRRKRF